MAQMSKECVKNDTDTEGADSKELWSRLDVMERQAVRAILSGDSHQEAIRAAGWKSSLSVGDVLGRPHVKEALTRLAPLTLPPKEAARALAPYVMAESVAQATSSGQGAREVRRDLLAIAGYSAAGREASALSSLADVLKAMNRLTHKTPTKALPGELDVTPKTRTGSRLYLDPGKTRVTDKESVDSDE